MTTLDPSRVLPTPWRNGAGATRELASAADDGGTTLWRISLADLDRDAPFSLFPGMDRLLVALGDLRLDVDGDAVRLDAGGQARFPGEARVSVALDRPTRALNVMTRRGVWRADVVRRPAAHPSTLDAHATVPLGELAADVLLTPGPKVARA